jgi:hypothetical protein
MLAKQDTVRIVACPAVSAFDRSNEFKVNINDRGCDFVFDKLTKVLVLRLRFDVLLGESDVVAPFVSFPTDFATGLLAIGNFITDRVEGIVYSIVLVEGNIVTVTNVATNAQSTLTIEKAVQLAKLV